MGKRWVAAAASVALCGAALTGWTPAVDAAGGGTVVIYSGRTQNLIEPILNRFAAETGIDVQVRYGNTSDLALLIEEEGELSPADVFLSQSPGAIGYLGQNGVLGMLPDSILALVPEQFHASDGSWVGVSGRQRVLAFNPETVSASELPDSVFALTEPEWEGRIGVAPANASFQDFVTAMRLEFGDDTTIEWLEGIAANDAFTFANNGAIVAAVGRGEIDVGLVNHYYVYRALDEDPEFSARNHTFDATDIGSLVIVTGVSVLADADHPDEAKALIEFLLTPEAQQYFSEETFEYPLANGAEPAEALPEVDLTAASDIELDLDDLGGDLSTTREMIRDAGLEG
ncbi:MAG: extracellular solute-binding protein [Acidimicrobiales bacterium]